jgi:hypothetical protein
VITMAHRALYDPRRILAPYRVVEAILEGRLEELEKTPRGEAWER